MNAMKNRWRFAVASGILFWFLGCEKAVSNALAKPNSSSSGSEQSATASTDAAEKLPEIPRQELY